MQDEGLRPAQQGRGNDFPVRTLRKTSPPHLAKPDYTNEDEGLTALHCIPQARPLLFEQFENRAAHDLIIR